MVHTHVTRNLATPGVVDEAAAVGDVTLTFGQSLWEQGMAGAPNKAVPTAPQTTPPAPSSPPPPPATPPPAKEPEAAAPAAAADDAAPKRGVPLAQVAGAGGAAAAAAWEGEDEEELWELARELLGSTHTVEGLNAQERAELLHILRENLELRKRLQDE